MSRPMRMQYVTWRYLSGVPVTPSLFEHILRLGGRLRDGEDAGANVQPRIDAGGWDLTAALDFLEQDAEAFKVELTRDEVATLLLMALAGEQGGYATGKLRPAGELS